jgi:DNA recombination protein RmuC
MITAVVILVSFSFGFVASWIYRMLRVENQMVPVDKYQQLEKELNNILVRHASELTMLQSELSYSKEKLDLQKKEIENIGEKFEGQFKILANSILDEKAERFNQQQEQNLKTILDPLKEHIKTFKDDYELKRSKESEERISLREQIRHMMDLNKTLSEQANNLTQVLRGNKKHQGNWGEMILESILQYAGLQKDIHYFLQQQSANAVGRIIQPDVIVRYPDNRSIVIDSKVSLAGYESLCSTNDKEQQNIFLSGVIRSIKNHVDELSARNYQDVADALDFVMMFVPVEAAYITAMQADNSLWHYAYNKKILLISPTNLIAAMKLIADMWQRDTINKEAHLIAEKAGRLYDKLVLFVENFEKVGGQLTKAYDSWNDAYKQLSKGKGNLISQAEQMKMSKAKASKALPAALVEEALIEDDKILE